MAETEGAHAAGFIGSDFEAHAKAGTPLGRIGQPDDIAKIAAWRRTSQDGSPASGSKARAGIPDYSAATPATRRRSGASCARRYRSAPTNSKSRA